MLKKIIKEQKFTVITPQRLKDLQERSYRETEVILSENEDFNFLITPEKLTIIKKQAENRLKVNLLYEDYDSDKRINWNGSQFLDTEGNVIIH